MKKLTKEKSGMFCGILMIALFAGAYLLVTQLFTNFPVG